MPGSKLTNTEGEKEGWAQPTPVVSRTILSQASGKKKKQKSKENKNKPGLRKENLSI